MSRPAASLDPRDPWEELLASAARQEGERPLLGKLLELVGRTCRLAAAAVYSAREGGFAREAAFGGEVFPATLRSGEQSAFTSLEIPAGLLLYRSAGPESRPPDGPAVTALATSLRAVLLERRLKEQRFEVNYRGVELEALYDVGLAIASTLNLEQLGEEVLLHAVSLLDARRGALYLVSRGRYRLKHTLGGDASSSVALDDVRVAELLGSRSQAGHDLLPGADHLLAVPVEGDGQPLGLLVVADKESRRGVGPFPDSDRRTLSLLANQAAIALQNAHLHRQALEKERLERELELAADIQRRLLPEVVPQVEGVELAGWSRPARHVGGDYYNLMSLPGGRVGAVLADVSGKGMPAALMVSTVHSALRLLLERSEIGPELVARLNQHIVDSSAPNKFITLLLAELDPVRDEMQYVNAGHNPGLLLHSNGEVAELAPSGFPLGLFGGSSYEAASLPMAPGDLLCVYSDGVTECGSPDNQEFGAERLIDLLRPLADRPLTEIVQAVDDAVTRFAQGQSQADDQTLVLLRRTA